MKNHWNMRERWKNTFFSHYENELFRIYLSLIWYSICISCKLMHDKILMLIFKYFAISSKTTSFFVPERAHYLGYINLGDFFPRFSKSLLKMVNITNFDLEYRVSQYCPYAVINRVLSPLNLVAIVQEVAALHLQACFHQNTGLELDGLQHMGNIGRLCIRGENSWYWPSWGATWRSMGRDVPGSFIKYSALLQGQNATLSLSWWQKIEYQRSICIIY